MTAIDFTALALDTLLLDWDGTLFDSFPAIIKAYKPISRELAGRELDVEWFRQVYSADYKKNLQTLGIPESQAETANQIFFENFEPASDKCSLFPGVEGVIKGLAKYFPKMGIYTMSRRKQLEKHLKRNKLDGFFQACVVEEDLVFPGKNKSELRKPSPFGLNLALKRLGSNPERTAFVGDTGIDFETGRNAGVRLVGLCTYGDFEKPEFLRALNADMYFEEPYQLLQLGEFRAVA